jgi:LysW-gamma-L-lysine carboxypeptidase
VSFVVNISLDFETLLGLVQRYSPTGQEGAAVAYLVQRMAELGYTRSFADPAGNAVGILGEGPRQFVLLGHIDTVPGEIPVRLVGRNGIPANEQVLYGRGSVDAKGPLAAFTDAVAALGAKPGWQLVVIGAVDEEGDSRGARAIVDPYRPEFAIIGEPSRWERITLGYKGSAWAEITCRRDMGHTASERESASEAAFAAWSRLAGWAEGVNAGRSRLFDRVSLTLRGLSSGGDGFEEWARLQVGVRLPLDFPPSAWYETLPQLLPGVSIQPTGYALPAYLGEKNTPLVRAFLAGIRAAGGEPGFVLKTGTSDLNIVAPVWGCPALAYGPGDSSLDHTPDEHISLGEYRRAVEVLEKVLLKLNSN